MTTPQPRPAPKAADADTTAAVDQFMSGLKHPHKSAIEALRQIVCGADPSIAEGIKWNAPSFRTTEYFATTQLRSKEGIGIILHLGAKARQSPSFQVEDPRGLIKWLAKDRASANFAGLEDVKAHETALRDVVREWIRRISTTGAR